MFWSRLSSTQPTYKHHKETIINFWHFKRREKRDSLWRRERVMGEKKLRSDWTAFWMTLIILESWIRSVDVLTVFTLLVYPTYIYKVMFSVLCFLIDSRDLVCIFKNSFLVLQENNWNIVIRCREPKCISEISPNTEILGHSQRGPNKFCRLHDLTMWLVFVMWPTCNLN